MSDGKKHDGRAPDYDDWSTVAENGKAGLNGDILIWYPVLGRSLELSSMGIRVDKESLLRQLALEGQQQRANLYFHRRLLQGELPLSIGGGIGQSRLCMVMLHKAHIGEIQASIWPESMRTECQQSRHTADLIKSNTHTHPKVGTHREASTHLGCGSTVSFNLSSFNFIAVR